MTPAESAAVVRGALTALWPGRFDAGRLERDTSLGDDGLGLDSIDLIELVLECEQRAGRDGFDSGAVLGAHPSTIGHLIDHLAGG